MPNPNAVIWAPVTILNGQTASNVINVQGYDIVGFQQPAGCEGVVVTFNGNVDGDGTAVVPVVDGAGAPISFAKSATVAQLCLFGQDKEIRGLLRLQVVTGAAQVGDVVIKVGLREVEE